MPDEVTLTLSMADLNNLVGVLAKASGPGISFEIVAPIIGRIQQQVQQQQGGDGLQPPMERVAGNGSNHPSAT